MNEYKLQRQKIIKEIQIDLDFRLRLILILNVKFLTTFNFSQFYEHVF